MTRGCNSFEARSYDTSTYPLRHRKFCRIAAKYRGDVSLGAYYFSSFLFLPFSWRSISSIHFIPCFFVVNHIGSYECDIDRYEEKRKIGRVTNFILLIFLFFWISMDIPHPLPSQRGSIKTITVLSSDVPYYARDRTYLTRANKGTFGETFSLVVD